MTTTLDLPDAVVVAVYFFLPAKTDRASFTRTHPEFHSAAWRAGLVRRKLVLDMRHINRCLRSSPLTSLQHISTGKSCYDYCDPSFLVYRFNAAEQERQVRRVLHTSGTPVTDLHVVGDPPMYWTDARRTHQHHCDGMEGVTHITIDAAQEEAALQGCFVAYLTVHGTCLSHQLTAIKRVTRKVTRSSAVQEHRRALHTCLIRFPRLRRAELR